MSVQMEISAADEARELEQLALQPWLKRFPAYLRLSGPGWLQGAMTLGGGSAITSLTIGGVYGYELLWVQPLSMLIGCIMLFALSYQTLSTGVAPFEAMRRHVNPGLAWAWQFPHWLPVLSGASLTIPSARACWKKLLMCL